MTTKTISKMTRAALLCAGMAFAALPAYAATQGAIGSTSTGTMDISATVDDLVRITGLSDIALGTWNGTGGLSGADNICVFSTTRGYTVTATGSGAANAFTLAATASTVAYSVEFAATADQTTGTALANGTPLTGQTTTATTSDCDGGASMNATVIVRISQAALTAAPAGAYTGTLTLVVAPE